MDESCPPPKLVYKVTNIPHNPLFIGVLVDPSWIRRITLFLMVFKSPLNSPPSLNHVSFIPMSPPRSFHEEYLCYNCYFNFSPFIESSSIVTNSPNIYVWIRIKIVRNKILRSKKARVYHK